MIPKTRSVRGGDILVDPAVDGVCVPVNCVGAMGAGLALAARRARPRVEAAYKRA